MPNSVQPNEHSTREVSHLTGRHATATRRLALMSAGALLAMSALAQEARRAPEPEALAASTRPPVLPCCKCLGGVSTLDLSTTAMSTWRVNGSPVVPVTQPNGSWNGLPPAIWVGPTASADEDNLASGVYRYSLAFSVPACEIGGPVTISGQMLADDAGKVRLKKGSSWVGGTFSTAPTPPGWGFQIGKLVNFSYSLTAGNYTLIVDVNNMGASPTGLVVKATASRRCGRTIGQPDPPKDDKE